MINLNPLPRSGNQELLENMINRVFIIFLIYLYLKIIMIIMSKY